MADFDLIVRGAENHPIVGISDGKFAGFDEGSTSHEIDAHGLLMLPGVIDAHVHFNEPGHAEWEGIATGSRACAAGGTTMFSDMPLNAHPPTCDGESFDLKRRAGEGKSLVDFALWGGLVPGNLDQLEVLRDRGVIGFKAFMSNSGIDDFENVDLGTLKSGMKRAAEFRLPVAVHAEIDHSELRHGSSVRDYLASRPIAIELEAVRAAIDLAGETRCALHIVHVSSADGVQLVADARARGVDVTCETCPHYLTLTQEDMERLGAIAKCAPPLRSDSERKKLLKKVRTGAVATIGSDHSPSPMSMKTDRDFFKVWGGISGCQHLLALVFDLDLDAARLLAANVADRFQLSDRKGRIAIGLDADFVLVDPTGHTEITAESLHYHHQHSPYVGRALRGRMARTVLRGQTVWHDGKFTHAPAGRFIRPSR